MCDSDDADDNDDDDDDDDFVTTMTPNFSSPFFLPTAHTYCFAAAKLYSFRPGSVHPEAECFRRLTVEVLTTCFWKITEYP
jgi:hypothetical protein